jgi:transposase
MTCDPAFPEEALRELLAERSEALLQIIRQLMENNAALLAKVSALEERVAELESQNRPPAAPFRRAPEEKKTAPGRPGRKPGHPGACRTIPGHIDEEVAVPLSVPAACPRCGGAFGSLQPCVQHLEEIALTRPRVLKLTTYSAACRGCGHTVASRHPQQVSTAGGCAGVHLGARAQALAAELKHGFGLTLSKTARVLRTLCGLHITRGGLVHLFARLSRKLTAACEELRAQLLDGPVSYSDETSWWVNGPASLWVHAGPDLTLYRVVDHRSRAVLHDTIPATWNGVLVSDCLSVYDTATAVQHKCYAHHLRALRLAAQNALDPSAWVEPVRRMLHGAMRFKTEADTLPPAQRRERRQAFDLLAQTLLSRPRGDPAEERLRVRLHKQQDHLFTFLDHAAVEATNNLAERELRPAVIARKLSCGHKTWKGADTWATLSSLVVTCARRLQDFAAFASPALLLDTQTPISR